MKVAFYKGKKHLFNRLVSWWDNGPYSHCELLVEEVSVPDGSGDLSYLCYSSSITDGGVRKKVIELESGKWDIIDVSSIDEAYAREWFKEHEGCKYDVIGLIGFLFRIIPGEKNRFFCSEAVAGMLGMKDGWRLSPNALFGVLNRY